MKKRHIVLVDDEKNMLDSLARILCNENYDIEKFESATDALEFIQRCHGEVDVIISDNKMPHLEGTDFLVHVRKLYPNIVRILLTGQSSIDDAKKAINEGKVYRFLTKPVDPYEMELIVKHALAHRDLWLKNRMLLKEIHKQDNAVTALESEHPGITSVDRDEYGNVIVPDDEGTDSSFDDFMKKYFT